MWQGGCMAGGHARQGGVPGWGHAWQGGMHGGGGGMHGKEVCVAGGMHGRGDMCGRGCVCGVGACVAGKTAIAAGGRHPTGMHFCLCLLLHNLRGPLDKRYNLKGFHTFFCSIVPNISTDYWLCL